ncbi:Cytolethal distending toxin A/C family [Pasteurella canis]|uniref:Cytolethal distending toxin A/C family n=2 Tax=Pasteurella canis TaxID=753 RepID=A0A379EXC6_9PAST|nr:cytolethal distending toxin subunit A [Pasteurella canis]SUC11047.1 Cytolethal distending toxin A/C family [Pasteurella canis]
MMKKYVLSLLLSMIFALPSYAESNPDPTTYPDVELSPPPRISLRSLFTGEPISNDHYGKSSPLNKHWELVDYTGTAYEKLRDGGVLVQFKVVGAAKCFAFQGVRNCTDKDNTVFSLIPTNTGAFLIKDVILGFCLTSRDFADLNLEPCGRSVRDQSFSLAYQWGLLPPFGPSKILVPPVKK